MNDMKRQKYMTLKDELPQLVGAQYATGRSGEIAPERMKRLNQSENNAQLWMWLAMEVKSDAVKNNIAWEPGPMNQGQLEAVKQEMVRVNINIFFFLVFYFLNFKIFNSYMRSQTWTPLPPPSP